MGEFRVPATGDEPTPEEPMIDSSLEGDLVVEEPVMEAPPTGEEPAVQHSASGCNGPQTPRKKTEWRSTSLRMILTTSDSVAVGPCTIWTVGGRRRRALKAMPRKSIMIRKLRKCVII